MPQIIGICGSLRAGSSNELLLRALYELLPPSTFSLCDLVGKLPLFNPDLDTDDPPAMVATLRAQWGTADGFVICSPEYAHGVPGALKNALDWIVKSGELYGKPVALITASPSGGDYAHAAMQEILTVLTARLVPSAVLQVRVARQAFLENGTLCDDALRTQLAQAMQALLHEIALCDEERATEKALYDES